MSNIFRYKITFEFQGTGLVGWQVQENGPSVQAKLEEAVFKFCGTKTRAHAAGRTDAGVHALGMVAHFDLPKEFDPFRVQEALNYYLRDAPLALLDCEAVDEEFHARFSAKKRYYLYHIINRRAPLTLMKDRAWQVKDQLDADAMHDAAQVLVGNHDFTTFRNVFCQAETPVKTLDQISVRRDGENVYIETSARSFLHHQVRSMVGCLYFVGKGKWTAQDLKEALEACDRQRLAYNAPPDGLYFMSVDY